MGKAAEKGNATGAQGQVASTPVPWRAHFAGVNNERDIRNIFDVVGSNGQTVADCLWEEDAQLIAAAPDLLKALEGVLRVADRQTDEFDAARAAIKKARGE